MLTRSRRTRAMTRLPPLAARRRRALDVARRLRPAGGRRRRGNGAGRDRPPLGRRAARRHDDRDEDRPVREQPLGRSCARQRHELQRRRAAHRRGARRGGQGRRSTEFAQGTDRVRSVQNELVVAAPSDDRLALERHLPHLGREDALPRGHRQVLGHARQGRHRARRRVPDGPRVVARKSTRPRRSPPRRRASRAS